MNLVNRTLEIDAETDARLREMAKERGQDVAAVLAEAVALLDSVVDLSGPDIGEDRRRYEDFRQTRLAVPLGDVKAWVASWGSEDSLVRNRARSDDPSFARCRRGRRATQNVSRSCKPRCRETRTGADLDSG
jgi:predicted transcriptional regulator